jgi:hypothetical protein
MKGFNVFTFLFGYILVLLVLIVMQGCGKASDPSDPTDSTTASTTSTTSTSSSSQTSSQSSNSDSNSNSNSNNSNSNQSSPPSGPTLVSSVTCSDSFTSQNSSLVGYDLGDISEGTYATTLKRFSDGSFSQTCSVSGFPSATGALVTGNWVCNVGPNSENFVQGSSNYTYQFSFLGNNLNSAEVVLRYTKNNGNYGEMIQAAMDCNTTNF